MYELIPTMINVGIALYGGGDPYQVLRLAKNSSKIGTAKRRMFETLLKQDKNYLIKAIDNL